MNSLSAALLASLCFRVFPAPCVGNWSSCGICIEVAAWTWFALSSWFSLSSSLQFSLACGWLRGPLQNCTLYPHIYCLTGLVRLHPGRRLLLPPLPALEGWKTVADAQRVSASSYVGTMSCQRACCGAWPSGACCDLTFLSLLSLFREFCWELGGGLLSHGGCLSWSRWTAYFLLCTGAPPGPIAYPLLLQQYQSPPSLSLLPCHHTSGVIL